MLESLRCDCRSLLSPIFGHAFPSQNIGGGGRAAGGWRQATGSGQRAVGSGQRTAGSGRQAAGSGQRAAGGRQRAAGSGPCQTIYTMYTSVQKKTRKRERGEEGQESGNTMLTVKHNDGTIPASCARVKYRRAGTGPFAEAG